MKFVDAWRRYDGERRRQIETRRTALVVQVEKRRQEYEQFIMPPRPRGAFWWMFIGDYERCCYERDRLSDRYECARTALHTFDSAIQGRNAALLQEIHADTEERCNNHDRAIMHALHQERRRRIEQQRLEEALRSFNTETGDAYRLAELNEKRNEKREATLVGRIQFDGDAYAKTTSNRGRTFNLYPWDEAMQQHVGRACWFWYDQNDRSHFEPLIGARGPVILGVQPLALATTEDKEDEQTENGKQT